MTTEGVEVQVQGLALPIGGGAFDDEAAMRQQKVEQMRGLGVGYLLGQHVSQRPGQVQHATFGVQMHL